VLQPEIAKKVHKIKVLYFGVQSHPRSMNSAPIEIAKKVQSKASVRLPISD